MRPFPATLPVLFGLACGGAGKGEVDDGHNGPAEAPAWSGEADAPGADSWPQYRREIQHLGQAHPEAVFDAPDGLEAAMTWSSDAFAIGDYSASKSSPTVAGDAVYIGVDDGTLRCLDRATGALRWTFRTHRADIEDAQESSDHHGVHGTAAVDEEGRVFIGDYSGWLYAIDAQDGSLLWEEDLGGSIGASPVLHDGMVFMAVEFPDPDGKIFVVDAATGALWYETPPLGNHPHSSVSLDPGRRLMTVGSNNGLLSAFDYEARAPLWVAPMRAEAEARDIKSTAAMHEGLAYITSWDHHLHVIDVEDGSERAQFAATNLSMSSPTLAGELVLFGAHDSLLYAVEGAAAGDPQLVWSADLVGSLTSSPTVVPASGRVLIGENGTGGDGAIVLLDLESGAVLDKMTLGGRVSSVPVVVDGELYVGDGEGRVWRFDAP
ncbi:MAG: PQQ-binding-like beta-propeller repeat protein [Deltaproteobacteria bacterium]|nr:PQQ-binding-like beta-propeller repeat protein [Deltaproteobacteria bacterium]